jgi:hypothetical protein
MLLTRIDELVDKPARDPEEILAAVEQRHRGRAESCRNAITTASVMVDEIRLRAHARPLDEPGR